MLTLWVQIANTAVIETKIATMIVMTSLSAETTFFFTFLLSADAIAGSDEQKLTKIPITNVARL